LQVTGSVGRAAEWDEAAAFEDAVGDGLGEVGVVEDAAPLLKKFVGIWKRCLSRMA
jgi:hypothetical protein